MYLEIKDVKKSYGKDAGYVQVLKGVSTGVEKGRYTGHQRLGKINAP